MIRNFSNIFLTEMIFQFKSELTGSQSQLLKMKSSVKFVLIFIIPVICGLEFENQSVCEGV